MDYIYSMRAPLRQESFEQELQHVISDVIGLHLPQYLVERIQLPNQSTI